MVPFSITSRRPIRLFWNDLKRDFMKKKDLTRQRTVNHCFSSLLISTSHFGHPSLLLVSRTSENGNGTKKYMANAKAKKSNLLIFRCIANGGWLGNKTFYRHIDGRTRALFLVFLSGLI